MNRGVVSDGDVYTRIAANFSAGIAAASQSHRFIALSDQDDVWCRDRLSRQHARLRKTGAVATIGDGQLIDEFDRVVDETLRDRFPILSDWITATPRARLESILRSPMATGAAMMIDRELTELALPIPRGWLHDRWFSIVATAAARLDVDDHIVIKYRISDQQAVGVRTQVNKAAWRHALEAAKRPEKACRRVRDLNRLRVIAAGQQMRSALTIPRLMWTYLAKGSQI